MNRRHPRFHPVILMPDEYPVFDFSAPAGTEYEDMTLKHPWGVGKYNEKRPAVYTTELFTGTRLAGQAEHVRDIHMGIDLFAPIGTPVHAFADSRVLCFGYNSAAGDYGYTVVTETVLEGQDSLGSATIYVLYGHLNSRSIEGKREGQPVRAGEVIAWVGDRHENGGYPPHLHFQLSFERPSKPDMPGAVSARDHTIALLKFPDPRLVLGPLY